MNYRELTNLGLADKEAKVYLAALELGKAPVQKIAQKAEVNRATTYVIIEALMKKGLMSSALEDKKQFFFAESPEKLTLLFREEEMSIQRKKEYLDKLMPELRSMKELQKEKPVVRFYSGKEGLITMAEEFVVVPHDEKARMIFSNDLLNNIFSKDELFNLRKKRLKQNIKAKAIINDDANAYSSDTVSVKLPSNKYPITSDIALFGDRVRIATQKGQLAGLIIDNKEIANTLKILFDLAWEYLKIVDKKGKG
jgi:sugar-specific transcriptional regulator TrmB